MGLSPGVSWPCHAASTFPRSPPTPHPTALLPHQWTVHKRVCVCISTCFCLWAMVEEGQLLLCCFILTWLFFFLPYICPWSLVCTVAMGHLAYSLWLRVTSAVSVTTAFICLVMNWGFTVFTTRGHCRAGSWIFYISQFVVLRWILVYVFCEGFSCSFKILVHAINLHLGIEVTAACSQLSKSYSHPHTQMQPLMNLLYISFMFAVMWASLLMDCPPPRWVTVRVTAEKYGSVGA